MGTIWLSRLWPILIGILVWWGFASFWEGSAIISAADQHEGFAAWIQAVGVFLAVFLGSYLTRRHSEREANVRRREGERLIGIRVAARLRPWLRLAVDNLIRVQQYEGSRGNDGSSDMVLPPFEVDPDLAANLSVSDAKKVYSLIEARARHVDVISGTAHYVDMDAARLEYYRAVVDLFDNVRALYRRMARATGLHEATVQPWELRAIAQARRDIKKAEIDAAKTSDF